MRKKKDILFLCQFFHPEYISSAQLPYDTAKALAAAGYSVGALCGYPREYSEAEGLPLREESEGVRIHRLRYLQLSRAGFLSRLVNYFSFTLRVLLHLREVGAYRCVVVYSNPPVLPWIASWAKCLFGTRLVFVAYDLYPEVATVTGTLGEGNPICRLMRHINKAVFRRADAVVALSREMREYILAHRDIPAERVHIIPNWYRDAPAPRGGENPFRGDSFTVAYFGNMGTMQDMQTILDAIRLLREEKISFLFAGHGNKLAALKEAARQEGLGRVQVLEFLHGEEFRQALAASDCALVSLERGAVGLCVPSKTYCYMMQGLPLAVVMDAPCDIVRDAQAGAGIWAKCGDAAALAEGLRMLRDNPDTLAQMGQASRALYLEKYTPDRCVGKYIGLFRRLLGQPEGETI